MNSMKFALLISSSPSARIFRFAGISSTSWIVLQVDRWLARAPLEFVEPRATIALATPGTSRISGANGGTLQASRSPTGGSTHIYDSIRAASATKASSATTGGIPAVFHDPVLQ